MDRNEAVRVLARELERYRSRPYHDLLSLLHGPETFEVLLPGGRRYQLEFQAFWDNEERSHLRLIGAIDDGGLSAFMPVSDDFIVAPDGSFIGE